MRLEVTRSVYIYMRMCTYMRGILIITSFFSLKIFKNNFFTLYWCYYLIITPGFFFIEFDHLMIYCAFFQRRLHQVIFLYIFPSYSLLFIFVSLIFLYNLRRIISFSLFLNTFVSSSIFFTFTNQRNLNMKKKNEMYCGILFWK